MNKMVAMCQVFQLHPICVFQSSQVVIAKRSSRARVDGFKTPNVREYSAYKLIRIWMFIFGCEILPTKTHTLTVWYTPQFDLAAEYSVWKHGSADLTTVRSF